MQANEQSHSIETEGRVAILNQDGQTAEFADQGQQYMAMRPETGTLFALAERSHGPLPERYPRLTFLAIALVLLISALTAEFEYLRVAGYSWP